MQAQASQNGVDAAAEQKKANITRLRGMLGDGVDQTGWSKAWQAQLTPWDSGGSPQPSLVSFLTETEAGKSLLQEGDCDKDAGVLVPGCGTGYDVEVFASLGFSPSVGIDIAPEATATAQRWFQSKVEAADHEQRYQASSVRFETVDFLGDDDDMTPEAMGAPTSEGFGLAYDYTFFCAIPPQLRAKWGQAYARAIKSRGYLITLVYPIDGDRQGGPPYSVSPELISSHLVDHFELVWQGVPPGQPETRKGMEQVMLWRRR